jgi:phosphoglycolate phosphatase
MKYKAVIFDLDGTLLDTLEDIANSVNTGLSSMGLPVHKIEAYKPFIGEGREALAIKALPHDQRIPDKINLLLDYINREYLSHWPDNTHLYPGIEEMLDCLYSRNIQMAILSNKPQEFTDVMVSRYLSKWHFEVIAGAVPSIPKKPDPAMAQQICEKMSLLPSQCVFLGDSEIDIKTAHRAGMFSVGATWGFRSAQELISSGARTLITYPSELLKLIH